VGSLTDVGLEAREVFVALEEALLDKEVDVLRTMRGADRSPIAEAINPIVKDGIHWAISAMARRRPYGLLPCPSERGSFRGRVGMSGRDKGKKLFADLADKVRTEVAPSGEPLLHKRGQKAVADLATDLSGENAPMGLRVFRDAVDRFRLQRPGKNAQIEVRWERPIGGVVVQSEKMDRRDPEVKYLFREAEDEWHRMEGEGELYEDISKLLIDYMYPEARRRE
jgi:hypothetical protein